MKGANEFYNLFETGQYDKLFIQTGTHARGKTIHIWIVPNGEEFEPKYGRPFNSNATEVYGITGGQPGWTETYGWLHKGEWVKDFENLVESKKLELKAKEDRDKCTTEESEKLKKENTAELLSKY